MKKLIGLAVAAVAVASLIPAASAAPKKQVEKGTLALPAPFTDDTGCYAGLHRRFAILTTGAVKQSPIGYHFDVDPATWNKNFLLQVDGSQGAAAADMDIYFYNKFGTPEDVAGDPLAAGAPVTVSYNTREAGGEFGKVPPDMTKIIVCMMGNGALNASFTYTAGKGVKAPQ